MKYGYYILVLVLNLHFANHCLNKGYFNIYFYFGWLIAATIGTIIMMHDTYKKDK